ncbi:hypothetical protein Peur_062788 [Populus x canadensis]
MLTMRARASLAIVRAQKLLLGLTRPFTFHFLTMFFLCQSVLPFESLLEYSNRDAYDYSAVYVLLESLLYMGSLRKIEYTNALIKA